MCRTPCPPLSAVAFSATHGPHPLPPTPLPLLQVYGLPALAMFKDGELIAGSKREGAITRAQLADYIKKNLA